MNNWNWLRGSLLIGWVALVATWLATNESGAADNGRSIFLASLAAISFGAWLTVELFQLVQAYIAKTNEERYRIERRKNRDNDREQKSLDRRDYDEE